MPYQPRSHPAAPPAPGRHAVVVVGGGLVGLTVALDLARRDIDVVVLDQDDRVSVGSRAICFAKRTLEIYDRLGLGARMLDKGVTWNRGEVLFGANPVYAFDLLPEAGHHFPAFVNLPQYYAEEWLVDACAATGRVDLRWCHRLVGLRAATADVSLTVETPAGPYELQADWLLACDGARSSVRAALDLAFVGKVFHDHFLIVDVVMHADLPAVRRFWFDPPFHPGWSVLLHRQPDDLWRIDFQLGPDTEPERERDPDRVRARVAAMLDAMGVSGVEFAIEWISIYTFRCRRLEKFRHGRILFLGDAAHQVSPFGARGGNGGVQDADNLGWKLAAVLRGHAPESLIESYDAERVPAADENILHSTRATDFITPKNAAARAYRDGVLELAAGREFARTMVNSGRLSRPAVLTGPLFTPDVDAWAGGVPPGAAALDAPDENGWLLERIGPWFTLLNFGDPPVGVPSDIAVLRAATDGLAARRYDARPGTAILFRPDQHVAARWRRPDAASIARARATALGQELGTTP